MISPRGRKAFTLGRLAELVGGTVAGDPERRIAGIQTLEEAGEDDLSFLTHPAYRKRAAASRAGALLVGRHLEGVAKDQLVAADPPLALGPLLTAFHPAAPVPAGVHPTAVLGAECVVHATAHLGAYVVLGDGTRVEAGAVLHPGVVVGRGCRVGEGAVLHPHAVLYDGTEVGARSIIHAGAVLGSDGFGYASGGGEHVKLPHVGRVVVEPDVEIGANTTVDRALLAETRIGEGTKIDNLVQVAHNVRVGRHCLLVSQVGIAGSTRLGDGVVLAGQAGVSGHLELGDGVRVAAASVVFKSLPAGGQYAGIPAIEAGRWRRQQALTGRLEEIRRRLRRLEERIDRSSEEE